MPLVFSILARMLRYSPFLNLSMALCWHDWQKIRKRLYLSPWAKILKTKDTLFPSTFKVWESKVPLVFSIFSQGMWSSHFFIFCWPCQQGAILEYRRILYLSLWAKNEKTKGTLLSQTLKVEENKVPLVFLIFSQGPRYGHFVNLQVFPFDVTYWK